MGRHRKPPKAKTPEELEAMAAELVQGYNDSLPSRAKSKPMSNYASQVGHPCTFFLWAKRYHWDEMPSPDVGLRNIFALGNEHEQAMKIRLLQDGWNVTKVETAFADEALNIHGYMDWELSHPTRPGWVYPVTVEMKTTAPTIYPTLHTFEGLFDHPKKWVCTTPYQVLSYAAMDPELRPQVAVVYRNKSTGAVKPLLANTADHVHRLGEVHDRIRVVNAALETGKAPDPILYDRKWCEGCDAAALCPVMQAWSGPVPKIIANPAIVDAIAHVHSECEAKAKMKKDAWEDLKDQVAHYGGWTDLDKGAKRQVVGARWRYECSVTNGGQKRLKAVAMTDDEAADAAKED